MTTIVQHAPRLSLDEIGAVARERFGRSGTLLPLPSERDQNYLIKDSADDPGVVLKIANATESRDVLDFQLRALAHLAAFDASLVVPRTLPALTGEVVVPVTLAGRPSYLARLLTYVPGEPLARVRPRDPVLWRSLGSALARMDRALFGFEHPAMRRELAWDLARTSACRARLDAIEEPDRRAIVERVLVRFEHEVEPRLSALRHSVIHNDWNDHNVLVDRSGARPVVVTAIDFGDMVYSATVCDVAIACTYAILDEARPLDVVSEIVAGFHDVWPIDPGELDVLLDLIRCRLAISVTMSAVQGRLAPDNAYLRVSERPAWTLLEALEGIPPAWGAARLRTACRYEPAAGSADARAWLAGRTVDAPRMLRGTPGRWRWVDLSIGSPALDEPSVADQPVRSGADAGAVERDEVVLLARFDEPRWLEAARRVVLDGGGQEAATISTGLTVWSASSLDVCSSFAGTVERVEPGSPDANALIVVAHAPAPGVRFSTILRGTLRPVEGVEPGVEVRSGAKLATSAGISALPFTVQIATGLVDLVVAMGTLARPAERAVWRGLAIDPAVLCVGEAAPEISRRDPEAILASRHAHLGRNLSLAYRRPLTIVRGRGAYLYDAEGRAHLDCVNNVAHVGHSHPRVAEAAARQMAVLNTNTRYLHDNVVSYAERLTALLPDPLRVCFFVNSGSEANDLAWRLARAYTGRRDAIVLDGAYHGNLSSLIELSPYKFEGPGGEGAPPHVHVAPMPDPYRGVMARREGDVASHYARSVEAIIADLAERGRGLAAFIAEAILSCGGQVVPPSGYFSRVYDLVRRAGGVCIADEVQVGFGRVGRRFWGFELHGVVPDIVTMGKPIGNGHPLGAVVTTPAVAAAFANGMEYFNTFGGNPVSCAVGLAVLDVIRDEQLQDRARRVGGYLAERLAALGRRWAVIGDVRGEGLFLGVEFVREPAVPRPAPDVAGYVVEHAKSLGVLLSTDGPDHNVIKIKPPLVFDLREADALCGAVESALATAPAAWLES